MSGCDVGEHLFSQGGCRYPGRSTDASGDRPAAAGVQGGDQHVQQQWRTASVSGRRQVDSGTESSQVLAVSHQLNSRAHSPTHPGRCTLHTLSPAPRTTFVSPIIWTLADCTEEIIRPGQFVCVCMCVMLCLRTLHLRRLYWCFDENWRRIWRIRERTEYIDIFLFSAHYSIVFCFQCSVYWCKGSVRF